MIHAILGRKQAVDYNYIGELELSHPKKNLSNSSIAGSTGEFFFLIWFFGVAT